MICGDVDDDVTSVVLDELPDDVLELVFSFVPYQQRRDFLPSVCKRWKRILAQPAERLWSEVVLDPTSGAPLHVTGFSETVAWLKLRAKGIRHLKMQLYDCVNPSRWAWARTSLQRRHLVDAPEALPLAVWLGPAPDARLGALRAAGHPSGPILPHGAPIQAGFLATVLKHSLGHLRSLSIVKCEETMSPRDYRAIGLLSRLETLVILNHADTLPARSTVHRAADFSWLAQLHAATQVQLELQIDGFPASVCQLTGLRQLRLKHVTNPDVPRELSQLSRLTSLALVDCSLCCVPEPVCQLQGLEELSLALNDLTPHWDEEPTESPPAFPLGLTKLTALRTLTLTCCDIEAVPDVVGRIASLEELYLSGNRVLSHTHGFFMLPSSFSALKAVTELCLSCCKLEAVPLELTSLRGLVRLNLSHNSIYDLPSTMASLADLQSLDLRHNRIHFFPCVLTRLCRLMRLDISHNKVQYDDTAVRVAMLPHLENFQFPSACDTFGWSSGDGLGELHGVSSATHFARMLMALAARRSQSLAKTIEHAIGSSPRPELLSVYANAVSSHILPDGGSESGGSESDASADEYSDDFELDSADYADDDAFLTAVRALGPLETLDDDAMDGGCGSSRGAAPAVWAQDALAAGGCASDDEDCSMASGLTASTAALQIAERDTSSSIMVSAVRQGDELPHVSCQGRQDNFVDGVVLE